MLVLIQSQQKDRRTNKYHSANSVFAFLIICSSVQRAATHQVVLFEYILRVLQVCVLEKVCCVAMCPVCLVFLS